MESYFFNKEVVVDAVYFKNQNGLTSYPKHMIIDGEGVTFKTGLERLAQEGKRAVRLFEMTDGQRRYRLKLDQEAGAWKLLRIASAV